MRGLVIAALLAAGCAVSPTAPDEQTFTEPHEQDMLALLQCNADFHHLGYHLDLHFWTNRRWITADDGTLEFQACGAWPWARYVECEHAWVLQAAHSELAAAAAHEVCHVTGDLQEPPMSCMIPALKVCP